MYISDANRCKSNPYERIYFLMKPFSINDDIDIKVLVWIGYL